METMLAMQPEPQPLILDLKVTYDTKKPPTVADIVKSLSSLEALVKQGIHVMDAAMKEIEVTSSEIYVQDVEAGSIIEWIKIEVFTNMIGEDNMQKLEEVGKDIIKNKMNNVIGYSVAALVGGGVVAAMHNASDTDKQVVNNYNSVNIVNLSNETGLSGEEIKDIVAANVNKDVAKSAVNFVQPAKPDSASITLTSGNVNAAPTIITSEVVDKAPKKVDFEPPETQEGDFQNIDLYIYASDQDKRKAGWAGIAPDLFEQRVKFELSDEIDPFELHRSGRHIKADITLVKTYSKDKKRYEPSKIIIKNTIK